MGEELKRAPVGLARDRVIEPASWFRAYKQLVVLPGGTVVSQTKRAYCSAEAKAAKPLRAALSTRTSKLTTPHDGVAPDPSRT